MTVNTMRKPLWITLCVVISCSALRSQISDRDSRQRMKQLNDLSKWSDAQNGKSQNRTPLAGGPDDDPTLAADVFNHEVSPAARKLAARAEHLSQKQQHEEAIVQLQHALEIDPHLRTTWRLNTSALANLKWRSTL